MLLLAIFGITAAAAQKPLYIINGKVCDSDTLSKIAPDDIEHIETLPADEQTIARFGPEAGNGVLLITLRYDKPARFPAADSLSFAEYIARRVEWGENYPTARVVVRYTVAEDGSLTVTEELEVTDKRLLRRVLKVLEGLSRWEPAMKNGKPVQSEGVLQLQLPAGRRMPRERYVVIR